jgi:hypothetical protein
MNSLSSILSWPGQLNLERTEKKDGSGKTSTLKMDVPHPISASM